MLYGDFILIQKNSLYKQICGFNLVQKKYSAGAARKIKKNFMLFP